MMLGARRDAMKTDYSPEWNQVTFDKIIKNKRCWNKNSQVKIKLYVIIKGFH